MTMSGFIVNQCELGPHFSPLTRDSYRLRNRDLGRIPAASHDHG